MRYRPAYYNPSLLPLPMAEAARRLDGRVYAFPSNIGGVMPMILQSVHNNFTKGLTRAAFDLLDDGGLLVELAEKRWRW